jgi:hypothetical protein
MMLNSLVKGMQEAGAEVDLVNLREKIIKQCAGCFSCWMKTPGKCIHKDDMTKELLPKWLASDVVIYASPLYYYMLNARMKNFLDRILPTSEPFIGQQGGILTHRMRQPPPDAIVLSVAGFPDMSVFDTLSHYVRFVFGHHHKLLAEIYRPAAEILHRIEDKRNDILDATIQAGRELVKHKCISTDTLNRIQQPIVDSAAFVEMTNEFWNTYLKGKV